MKQSANQTGLTSRGWPVLALSLRSEVDGSNERQVLYATGCVDPRRPAGRCVWAHAQSAAAGSVRSGGGAPSCSPDPVAPSGRCTSDSSSRRFTVSGWCASRGESGSPGKRDGQQGRAQHVQQRPNRRRYSMRSPGPRTAVGPQCCPVIWQRAINTDEVELTFILPSEHPAYPVGVAGEFNAWQWPSTPFHDHGGCLVACIIVAAGSRYRFRYRSADGTWFNDDRADDYVDSPYGGIDCVFDTDIEHRVSTAVEVEKLSESSGDAGTDRRDQRRAGWHADQRGRHFQRHAVHARVTPRDGPGGGCVESTVSPARRPRPRRTDQGACGTRAWSSSKVGAHLGRLESPAATGPADIDAIDHWLRDRGPTSNPAPLRDAI